MKGRDPLAVAAVLLACVAFAGSFDHVRSVVDSHGQTGWLAWAIAAMPEVSVALAVMKVRRARTTGEATGWAWLVGTSAAAFTVSANLATAQANPWGYVAAAWPAWASIGAFGLIEVGGGAVQVEPEPVLEAEVPAEGTSPGPEVLAPALEAAPDPEPVSAPQTAPEPRPLPVAAARQERPGAVTVRATSGGPRTVEALLPKVKDAIQRGRLDPNPSAERIRLHLACAPATARQLRDQLRTT